MGISRWLERRTRERKVGGSSPGRSGGRIFFSRVKFFVLTFISVSVSTFVSLQWHVKYLSHFAKRAGARLQLKLSYAACTLRMWLNLHEVTRHGAWMYAVQRVRASVRSQVCAC